MAVLVVDDGGRHVGAAAFATGMVAGRGRKIRAANTVAPASTGAPTTVTTSSTMAATIRCSIRTSSLIPGSKASGPLGRPHVSSEKDRDFFAIHPYRVGAQRGTRTKQGHLAARRQLVSPAVPRADHAACVDETIVERRPIVAAGIVEGIEVFPVGEHGDRTSVYPHRPTAA